MTLNRREFLSSGSTAALSLFAVEALCADAPRSPITNCWGQVEPQKLILEEVCVFQGRLGAAYNHHHQVLHDRGRLYVSWSDGITNEDNPGQHMLLSTSDDDGAHWSTPTTITPSPPEKTSVFTAMGIRAYKNELIAYYGHYAYTDLVFDGSNTPLTHFAPQYRDDPQKWVHRDTYTEVRISKDRGVTWGKPARIIERFVPNLRPFPTQSGRLIITGNIAFPYTDDPQGIHNWKFVGIPRLPQWTVDDSEGFHKACAYRHDAQNYCEASFYQTDDT
jgi:hypothetical protein